MALWLRLCLPVQGAWVWSLIRKLRSHMPHCAATKKKVFVKKKKMVRTSWWSSGWLWVPSVEVMGCVPGLRRSHMLHGMAKKKRLVTVPTVAGGGARPWPQGVWLQRPHFLPQPNPADVRLRSTGHFLFATGSHGWFYKRTGERPVKTQLGFHTRIIAFSLLPTSKDIREEAKDVLLARN